MASSYTRGAKKVMVGEREEWSGDTHQGSLSITDRGIAPHTQHLEELWPMRWRRCPMQELHWWGRASGVVYPAPSCRGLVQNLVFFFLLRMILVSCGSVGSFWVVHSASSRSAWFAFFALLFVDLCILLRHPVTCFHQQLEQCICRFPAFFLGLRQAAAGHPHIVGADIHTLLDGMSPDQEPRLPQIWLWS